MVHPVEVMPGGRARRRIAADRPFDPRRFLMRGLGRTAFAATLLLILGVLNIIYGIGALDGANIFTDEQRYVLDDLNTLGRVLLVLGVIQLIGGVALMGGHVFGRIIGIVGASLGAIGALLSIGGANPFWSFGLFLLCLYIIHGIFIYGEDTAAR